MRGRGKDHPETDGNFGGMVDVSASLTVVTVSWFHEDGVCHNLSIVKNLSQFIKIQIYILSIYSSSCVSYTLINL